MNDLIENADLGDDWKMIIKTKNTGIFTIIYSLWCIWMVLLVFIPLIDIIDYYIRLISVLVMLFLLGITFKSYYKVSVKVRY